ncbi:MarR family transcriptional regulator [Sphingomonas sp. AP4-R1]|nr:MarR family transcriptional regulator [Sphingomonas sp. AP4-R1]
MSGPIDTALARIDEACDIGTVVVDASVDVPELDRLFDRLEAAAREGRFRSVLTISPDLIDLAARFCPHPHVDTLCRDGGADGVAALAVALAGARRIPQRAAEDGPMRLKQLSEEVGRIARTLAALSENDERMPALRPIRIGDDDGAEPSAAMIRACIRARRMRELYFPADLFADPAWDMLLDLMAARIEGRRVAVSSLCIAGAVPATTGLRWIKTLTDGGLFLRVADPRDGRRIFIELSEAAARGMSGYFRALDRAGLAGV